MQFYPSNPAQIHMITTAAMKCGFSGGVVIDFPHSTRAKKHFLVIQAGQVGGTGFEPPAPLTSSAKDSDDDSYNDSYDCNNDNDDFDEESENRSDCDERSSFDRIQVGQRHGGNRAKRARADSAHGTQQQQRQRRRKDNRPATGTREWVLLKKDERRRRGLKTTDDSKYTMRQRRPRF
uniref:Putative methyltransferase WBSCR22 n=1 Tax=Lygus hesperus TaxID=30085 RepID=A0A0A9YM10_LYGHE